jgi:hypothetical protein
VPPLGTGHEAAHVVMSSRNCHGTPLQVPLHRRCKNPASDGRFRRRQPGAIIGA